MKRRTIILLSISSAVFVFAVTCFSTVLYQRRHGDIFKGIEFSASFTDCNGEFLQVFLTSDEKYRIFCPLANFSNEFLEAILLQEDRYFYSHDGVNLVSVVKAAWTTYVKKSRVVGASTITMQAAKLKYNIYTKSVFGKIRQIIMAKYLEMCFSKQQILELYMNLVPVGGNLEGFATGSLYYFHKTVQELNLSETIMLCVLPQNPTKRAPIHNRTSSELIKARKVLFASWLENHPENKNQEIYMDMQMSTFCSFPDEARHFCEMLYRKESVFTRSPLRTSLDLRLQKKSEQVLEKYINQNKNFGLKNGAIVLLDWQNMEVMANIGSASFYDEEIQGQVNATTSKRSPGSTLKPFIYAMAMDQGIIHYSTMLKDTPQAFSEYTPDNYGSVFKGPVKAWFALVDSRNIPAITLAQKLKKPDLYDFMKATGVTRMKNRDYYGLSIVLGSCETTMNELVKMYAIIPNGGVVHELNFTHPSRVDRGKRLLSDESTFIVQKMLEKNIPPYSQKPVSIKDIPIAYKTGTSIGFKDGWSVGIFDRYILCVWVGNFDGQGNNAFIGRQMAAPLLFNLAYSILIDTPKEDLLSERFPSEKLTQVQVCSVSGCLPNENCPTTEPAWFIPGVSPLDKCKIHRKVNIDTRTGFRTDETDAPYVKSVVREFWPTDLQELFAQSGFPRIAPPEYPKENQLFDLTKQGFPPHIDSPMTGTDYVFRRTEKSRNKIVLSASSDADTDELLWFCNSDFIARTQRGHQFEWYPEPGQYEITVTDSLGRSDSVYVSIIWED